MDVSLPFWTIPLAITIVGGAVTVFWPYEHAGDYGFNVFLLIAPLLWIIGSLVAWLIYFMVF